MCTAGGRCSVPYFAVYSRISRSYKTLYEGLRVVEWYLDLQAWSIKTRAWVHGLLTRGFYGAHLAASGLA